MKSLPVEKATSSIKCQTEAALSTVSRKHILTWLLIGSAAFLLYGGAIDAEYYSDDFLFVSEFPRCSIVDHFLGKGRQTGFYRPVEALVLACIQKEFAFNTIPIHLVAILLHSLVSALVFSAVLKFGFSQRQAILATLFMLLSQANVSAVLGNDALSQVSGTLFGCLSLWWLTAALGNLNTARPDFREFAFRRKFCMSVAAFAVALLSKESSVSFFLLLSGVVGFYIYELRNSPREACFSRKIIILLPYVIVLVAYIWIRYLIGSGQMLMGTDRYNINFGANIAKNLTLLFVASVTPLSTVTVFTKIIMRDFAAVAVIVIMSVAFVGLLVRGLWQSRHSHCISILTIGGTVGLFPMVLLNHVSELYAYNVMPFVAIAVGVSLGSQLERANTWLGKRTIQILVLMLLVSHIVAVNQKSSLMKENGRRAAQLLDEIKPYAQRVSQNGELLLVNDENTQPEYSVFLMTGFKVLAEGETIVNKVADRPDIKVKIINDTDPETTKSENPQAVVLYLEGMEVLEKTL